MPGELSVASVDAGFGAGVRRCHAYFCGFSLVIGAARLLLEKHALDEGREIFCAEGHPVLGVTPSFQGSADAGACGGY